MIFPPFIGKGDLIGICAPSDGIGDDEKKNKRLDSAMEQFRELGFVTTETKSVRRSEKGRSADAETRAGEFMSLIRNPECRLIIASGGGDWLFELLPYIDFDEIAKDPTWFQGMSDPTILTYTITTITHVATVYSTNAGSFGMRPWDKTLTDNINILKGDIVCQKSSDLYQSGWLELTDGLDVYKKDTKTFLKRLDNYSSRNVNIKESGRLLGGCMDCLVILAGTKYDKTVPFIETYRYEGIIWYLEIFSMTPEQIAAYLWKFKTLGWFKFAKAFVFGRQCMVNEEYSSVSYEEAILSALGDLNVPVITGADIGHRPPSMTIINGAVGELEYDGEGLTLNMSLMP